MNGKRTIAMLLGITCAGLWATQAAAGLIELEKTDLNPNVLGGGGRTTFEILGYQDTPDLVLGPLGSSIYAVCIEPNEYIGGNGDTRWYEIGSLAGAHTSQHPGITAAEVAVIERVLSELFNPDLTLVGTGNLTTAITALQAMLWEASLYDLLDGVQNYGTEAIRSLANQWVLDSSGWIDTVTSYALLVQGRQDFITFMRDPSDGSSLVPTPAPLLLVAGGLLALRGAVRRRC